MIAVSVFNHPGIHRHLSLGRIFHFHSIYEPNPKFKSPSCSRASKRHLRFQNYRSRYKVFSFLSHLFKSVEGKKFEVEISEMFYKNMNL